MFGFLFAAQIHFDDALVVLDFIDRAFAENGSLMKDGDLARDLAHKRAGSPR